MPAVDMSTIHQVMQKALQGRVVAPQRHQLLPVPQLTGTPMEHQIPPDMPLPVGHPFRGAAPPLAQAQFRTVAQGAPAIVPGPEPAFRWGGELMYSPEEAVGWMRARGVDTTVDEFLRNHPHIAELYGRPVPNAPRVVHLGHHVYPE